MPKASEIIQQFIKKELHLRVISFVFVMCYGSPLLRAHRFAITDFERAIYGVCFPELPRLVHWSLEGKFYNAVNLLIVALTGNGSCLG